MVLAGRHDVLFHNLASTSDVTALQMGNDLLMFLTVKLVRADYDRPVTIAKEALSNIRDYQWKFLISAFLPEYAMKNEIVLSPFHDINLVILLYQ